MVVAFFSAKVAQLHVEVGSAVGAFLGEVGQFGYAPEVFIVMGFVDNDVIAAGLIPGDGVTARNLVDFFVYALLELVALLLDSTRILLAGLLIHLIGFDFVQVALKFV